MRIAVLGSGTTSRDLPAHLATLRDAATQVEILNPRLVAFPATPYERLLVDVGYVDAAEQAQRQGYDAVVINSFADYGIAAARAAGITMVGSGESALQAARQIGERFSIVTIWPPSMVHLYAERLQSLGLVDHCVRIRHVGAEADLSTLGSDDNVMARLHRGEDALVQRVLAECRAAIAEDGIQSIVLGCTCMAPIAADLAAELSVPVLEGSALAVSAARALRSPGTAAPRSADRRTTSGHTPIGTLVSALLGDGGSSAPTMRVPSSELSSTCDVCVP